MIFVHAIPQKRKNATEGYRGMLLIVLTASVRIAISFTIFPSHTHIYYRVGRSNDHRLLQLKFAGKDDIGDADSDSDDFLSPCTTNIPLVTDSAHSKRYNNNQRRRSKEILLKKESVTTSKPTIISDTVKEILTAPVIPGEEKQNEREKVQRLIFPVSASEVSSGSDVKSKNTVATDSNILQSDSVVMKNRRHSEKKFFFSKRWRRLRPGQKFRFRLGMISVAFASLWNTVVVRKYSSFIISIITGAATTGTATGFGSILRRWFSNRGFQGVAALGRSFAYGWAVFVAYPRMLDRRTKERRIKREEQVLTQWRNYLKGTSDEVVRLRKELSLLEGEIRAFRREILSIRATRIDSGPAMPLKRNSDGLEDNNSTDSKNYSSNSNESDRILREAIIDEMAHLTRLRDDTRFALTKARNRWSEVRAKRPIIHSQAALTSTFDALEFELDAVSDFRDSGSEAQSSDDDPLLNDFFF
mmetsp:Transcript_6134/g.15171  ORF Transcript_6134/g.15171 Transcript_6134/m.15171 type:complete len:472 (+) Transcript_6134:76-1491(+)